MTPYSVTIFPMTASQKATSLRFSFLQASNINVTFTYLARQFIDFVF